jgi:hypothetical protein
MTVNKQHVKGVPAPVERAVLRKFNVAERADVPTGRKGKHKEIVTQILSDLEGLEKGQCLKIPLDELPDSKVNIRSALSRAAHKLNQLVATAADAEFLYVWNA